MDLRKFFSFLSRLRQNFFSFDRPLAVITLLLLTAGVITLYSAALDMPGKLQDQLRNIGFAFIVMWLISRLSPQMLMRVAVPVYTIGLALLVAPQCQY